MNRKILLLSTALMAAMMLSLAVAPAMAKPNTVTVVLKYNNGKPYVGQFTLWDSTKDQWYVYTTDSHGKKNVDISTYSWSAGDNIVVESTHLGEQLGSDTLSTQLSARIVNTNLTPPRP